MSVSKLSLVVVCLALVACYDTDLPQGSALSGGDPGPSLALVGPARPTLSLSSAVTVEASDLDGVAEVSLRCGGAPLASWQNPPYQALVDLQRCLPFAAPESTRPGFLDVTLTLAATDRLGHASQLDVPAVIDVSQAALTTDLPAQLPPSEPVDFTVRSDRALQASPKVQVGARVAQVAVDPADANLFHVHLDQGPGFTSGSLTESEELTSVVFDAVAQNGNATHLELPLRLSKVFWVQELNVTLFNQNRNLPPPVATPDGLSTTFAGTLNTGGVFQELDEPLVVDARSGAVQLFVADAGFAGNLVGITRDGLYAYGDGARLSFFDPTTQQSSPPVLAPLVPGQGTTAPLPVADGLVQTSSAPSTGCPTTTTFQFASPSGTVTAVIDAGSPNYEASSGDSFVLAGVSDCIQNTGWIGFTPPSTTLYFEESDPLDPTCVYSQVHQLLGGGDGTYAIVASCFDGRTDAFLTDAKGNHLGAYAFVQPLQTPGETPLGLYAAHQLLTVDHSGLYTIFRGYPADGGAPIAYSTLLSFATTPNGPISRPDGGVDLLLQTMGGAGGATVYDVVQLGEDLAPQWIYRLPNSATPSPSGTQQLVADPNGGPVYVIDPSSNSITALQR